MSSVTMWYSPGKSPNPSKTSLYSSRRSVAPAAVRTLAVDLGTSGVKVSSLSLMVTRPSSKHVLYDSSGARVSSVMLKFNMFL